VDEQLGLLVELQELDTRIIAHSRTIKDIPSRLSSMEKPLKAAEDALAGARKDYEALEKKKRDREASVEENNDHLKKLNERTRDIKDNKAYQAHLKEIENVEAGTVKLEDEVLEAMEKIEAEDAKINVAEDSLKVEQLKAEALKKELDKEVEEAKAGLDEMKSKRSGFVSGLEQETYELYMDLLGSRGGVAVTSVDDEICGGCNMNIMPQLYVEITKNKKVIPCPQCRRILYHKPEAPASPPDSDNEGQEAGGQSS